MPTTSSSLLYVDEPFAYDIIGDVHGCYTELVSLLQKLGYEVLPQGVLTPVGRKLIFVGDLTDRGPDSPAVLRLVMQAVAQGVAYCVCGNHDDKLCRYLKGNKVSHTHGLDLTIAQLQAESEAFLHEIRVFLAYLPTHLIFDGGNLVVAHAGLAAQYHGTISDKVRALCLYGEQAGGFDADGLPQRVLWARNYTGEALVVYGHTPIREAEWCHNTIDIDTGCVFGGKLTALRYPERTLAEVAAHAEYAAPKKPLATLSERMV